MAWKRRPRRRRIPTLWVPPPSGLARDESPIQAEPFLALEDSTAPTGTFACVPLIFQLWKDDDGTSHDLTGGIENELTDEEGARFLRILGEWKPIGVTTADQQNGRAWAFECRYALARLPPASDPSGVRGLGTPLPNALLQPDLFSAEGLAFEDIIHMRSWSFPDPEVVGIEIVLDNPPVASNWVTPRMFDLGIPWYRDLSTSVVDCRVQRRQRDSTRIALLRQFRCTNTTQPDIDEAPFFWHADWMRVLAKRPS